PAPARSCPPPLHDALPIFTFRGTPQSTGSCDAINPCGLVFEGSQGYNIDAIDTCCATGSNSNFVVFDHVEIRKATYHAGLYQEGDRKSTRLNSTHGSISYA